MKTYKELAEEWVSESKNKVRIGSWEDWIFDFASYLFNPLKESK